MKLLDLLMDGFREEGWSFEITKLYLRTKNLMKFSKV